MAERMNSDRHVCMIVGPEQSEPMVLIRTLLMAAAKRVASDPELRGKATDAARDHVLPAARTAARKSGETVRKVQDTVTREVHAAMDEAPPEATRAEIAGRTARRFLDRMKDPD
jgi:hypothetical protein